MFLTFITTLNCLNNLCSKPFLQISQMNRTHYSTDHHTSSTITKDNGEMVEVFGPAIAYEI
jgi:hypothetical protein